MGRWTQDDQDDARLPEGMKRIGYDADTRQYLFRDCYTGELYHSEPGNEYGLLLPANQPESGFHRTRPSAFASSADSAKERANPTRKSTLTSFEEFLPSKAITSPPSSPSKHSILSSSPDSSGSRFPDVFRKVTASKIQAPPREGVRHKSRSLSLPMFSFSGSRDSPPPVPRLTHRHRGYARQGEDTKALLRSKTVSSQTSRTSRESSSFQSRHAPDRSSSRASRMSAASTTSTVTPARTG